MTATQDSTSYSITNFKVVLHSQLTNKAEVSTLIPNVCFPLYNKLSGKIPQSMGSLTQLIALDLSNNSLSGELPWSLQNCTMLRFL